ncbi:MAG TPA: iron-containing alcohol dehydrogenase [Acidobacteriaceae bacterium]
MSFTLALPRISLSGPDAILDSVAWLEQQGFSKVLILTDQIIRKLDGAKLLLSSLDAKKISYSIFDAIGPNPTVAVVNQAFAVLQHDAPDAIVALGGGSVIDTGKAIRILSANPGPINQYEGVHHELKIGLPLVAIATTSGTAAEVTSNAVITDTDRHVKMVIISHATIPDIAVNDPIAVKSMPPGTTAATGMDALTHAIEAYVSKGAHPLTDPTALAAIRIIPRWLPIAYKDGSNLEAREQMATAQFLAGMAFNNAGLGCVHSLAHQPGATHNLPHGVCNAILLPIVEEFNRDVAQARFATIAEAMGVDITGLSVEEASKAALAAIRALAKSVDIPSGFAALGIVEADIEQWIEPALHDPCTPGNPKTLTPNDVRTLYKQAL